MIVFFSLWLIIFVCYVSYIIPANEFPSSFESIVRKIVRLLFHVIAHLYAAHFREVVLLGLHAHLNLTFAHLTALHNRFSLIDAKETEVLRDLEVALRLTEECVAQDSDSPYCKDTTTDADSCVGDAASMDTLTNANNPNTTQPDVTSFSDQQQAARA